MKKGDVPQDNALFEDRRAVVYAVDSRGKYTTAPTSGWEPANIANAQAWEDIRRDICDAVIAIKRGELSPLAYHMLNNLMDTKLLAKYAKLGHWRVKRHLRPKPFAKLNPALRKRYAEIFSFSVDELDRVPTPGDLHCQEL